MRTFIRFALVGAIAVSGACTTNNTTTTTATPSANAVIPASGFIGRQMRVEISGDNTTWTSAATVSFGAGVTVGTVTVASPTDLFAEITIAPTAASGLRDVKVSDGGVDATLTQAFQLDNPVTLEIQGTTAQGSIGLFTLTNHDFDNAFDTTSVANPNNPFGAPVFTNLAVNGPTGVTFTVSNVTGYTANGTILLDTNAAPGAVTIESGPTGTIVTSPAGNLAVAARSATVLALGVAGSATVAKAFDSQLFEYDAAAPGAGQALLNTIAATTTSTTAAPTVFLLPASGAWADELTSGASVSQITSAVTKYYAVTLDTSGAQGFQYGVKATALGVTIVNEVEPNNTVATAQTATVFPAMFSGATGAATLTDDTDVDFIKITVPAGKKVHVITVPGDPQCDTVVDVLNASGVVSLGGPSADTNYHEDFTSTAVPAAGTYLVKISASQAGFFSATMNHYQAVILLE